MQSKIFQGLKKRPTFNEIVGYLETEQQILKYPDRTATRIKDDPYYTNLDGQGGLSLGEQSKNLQKEQMRQLELNKIYQNMGISANVGRAMGIDRADGSESIVSGSNRSGGSNGSEYGGGGSVFGSVADSNIEDDYEALETFGKEQETLKEDKTKKISEKVAPAVQPSFVDTFTGGASSSSAPAKAPSAPIASSSSPSAPAVSYEEAAQDYASRSIPYLISALPSTGTEYLKPTKTDRDENGNLNDVYKNKLINKLLNLKYPNIHKTAKQQQKILEATQQKQGKNSKKIVEDDV